MGIVLPPLVDAANNFASQDDAGVRLQAGERSEPGAVERHGGPFNGAGQQQA
jgi:hypothetical protein